MKYVVMVSHGEFAPGLHSAVKMMTGDREDVLSTSLKSDMSADEFAANFEELVKDFTTDDQVILLADILSGSPFTNALNEQKLVFENKDASQEKVNEATKKLEDAIKGLECS